MKENFVILLLFIASIIINFFACKMKNTSVFFYLLTSFSGTGYIACLSNLASEPSPLKVVIGAFLLVAIVTLIGTAFKVESEKSG